jgi:tRNA pseudouridine55 synthase
VSAPEGLLLVDKPRGITSHDVVDKVRRALGTKKVGHAGTLDPMATGLMLIGVGRATRLLRYLTGLDKTYEGTGRLGEETDTLDADGKTIGTSAVNVTVEALEEVLASLTGDQQQIPPAFSAIKVGGKRLYEAARKGEEVSVPPRRVFVRTFDLMSFVAPDLDFRVECSSGTYIRSLVADAGVALGCGAHLVRLVRTHVGPFALAEATAIDAMGEPHPLSRAVEHLPRRNLDAAGAAAAAGGRSMDAAGLDGPYGVYGPDGSLIAVYRDEPDGEPMMSRPEMVLAPSQGPEVE